MNKHNKAFTLIELLVVIAIIALLLSIIIPSLRLAKQKAASIICMTNVKNLSLGWFSYKEDNNSNIMSSCFGGTTNDGTANGKRIPAWIEAPRNISGTVLGNQNTNVVTDEDEIRGIELGAIHPYLKSPKVFNCPADKVKALAKYDSVDPEKLVTYAIPDCLAGKEVVNQSRPNDRILKYSDITNPSGRYNFVETAEERNYTTLGHFVFGGPDIVGKGNPNVWWGPMSVNHGDASVLGFCDGHSEVQKWQSKETKDRVQRLSLAGTDTYGLDTASGHNHTNDDDVAFMAAGWAFRYK